MTTATQSDIADQVAVKDIMIRYATSCDARDMEAYGSCFTEDVLISGFGAEDFHGRQAWVDYVTKALTRFSGTQHMLGNQVVQVNGDEATLQTSVQATHFLVDRPGTALTLFATYYDKLIRKDGEWQIYDHRLVPVGTQVLTGEQ